MKAVWGQAPPVCLWATPDGGPGYTFGRHVAIDAANNCYATGRFNGTVRFGTVTLSSHSEDDIYLAKYGPNGQLLWVRQAGGPGYDFVFGLTVDAAGNAYLTGYFASPINSGLPATIAIGTVTLTGGSQQNELFLAKYDTQGNVLWARQSVSTGNSPSWGTDVAVDNTGNVYLTGIVGEDTRFDGLTFHFATRDNQYLAKYSSQGTLQWVKTGLGSGANSGHEQVALDAQGQIYLVGYFTNSVTLGDTTLTSAGPTSSSMYLVKYTAQGKQQWVRQGVEAAWTVLETCWELAVAPQGDAVLSCNFGGPLTHGSQTFTTDGHTTVGRVPSDILLLKYNAQGTLVWGRQVGGNKFDAPQGMGIDANGSIYLNAEMEGMRTPTVSSGTDDRFFHLFAFSSTGALTWTRPAVFSVADVAASPTGQLWLTGNFQYTTYLDNFALTSTVAGTWKSYVATLAAPAGDPTVPNIITPNGDSHNDAFELLGLPPGPWQLTIYSRWGTRLYHSNDYRQDWNAPGLPDGQYYYCLQAPNRPVLKGWLEVVH